MEKAFYYIYGVPGRGIEVAHALAEKGGIIDSLLGHDREDCIYFINKKGYTDFIICSRDNEELIKVIGTELTLPKNEVSSHSDISKEITLCPSGINDRYLSLISLTPKDLDKLGISEPIGRSFQVNITIKHK